MPKYRTAFNGYAVAFSPFLPNRLAVATAQNFGIIGNGRQHVLEIAPNGSVVEVGAFNTADGAKRMQPGLYDCCWSEENENILISASGDGSVKVWDLSAPPQANPLRSFEEHAREVYSVAYNLVRRDSFVTASWDFTAKHWSLGHPHALRTFEEHGSCLYCASWSPTTAEVFATASGDCTVKVWDIRQPFSTLTIPAHDYEVLSCDWNKYNDCVLATGSVDKTIRTWDVRNPSQPLNIFAGHSYAVRRVKWSPHSENVLFSCSYDMTLAMWNTAPGQEPLIRRWDQHTEFVVGLDVSSLVDGLVASTGWDEMVYVWPANGDPRAA